MGYTLAFERGSRPGSDIGKTPSMMAILPSHGAMQCRIAHRMTNNLSLKRDFAARKFDRGMRQALTGRKRLQGASWMTA
jgi:hypothetical protein